MNYSVKYLIPFFSEGSQFFSYSKGEIIDLDLSLLNVDD